MKKGQIEGQVLIYILATFIAIIILLYGYTAVKGLLGTQQEILITDFKNDFRNDVRKVFLQFGSYTTKEYVLPDEHTRICLVDRDAIGTEVSFDNDLVSNSVSEGAMKDVFLFSGNFVKNTLQVDNLALEGDVECYPITDGILKLKLESKGREGVEIKNE